MPSFRWSDKFLRMMFLVVLGLCIPAGASDRQLWSMNPSAENGDWHRRPDARIKIAYDQSSKALIISGSQKRTDDNAILTRDFVLGPNPTRVQFTVKRMDPSEGGTFLLTLQDYISNATVTLGSYSPGHAAWTSSPDGGWYDWKGTQQTGLPADAATTYAIEMTGDSQFRFLVEGKQVGAPLSVPNLRHIHRIQLHMQPGKQGFALSQASAVNNGVVTKLPSIRNLDLAATKLSSAVAPTNPRANGYQVAFFERGFSDAMHDPVLNDELARTLKTLGAGTLRFPGGNWAYSYFEDNAKAYAALARVGSMVGAYYFAATPDVFRWVNDEQFFTFCKKAGTDTIYQINIGYWYDAQRDRIVTLAPMGSTAADAPVCAPEFMQAALAKAKQRAELAKRLGVKVIWEMGNEDYCHFTPEVYAQQVIAFAKVIREVDPAAEILVCGDSFSWSDWSWADKLFQIFKKEGYTDINETGVHIYFSGGGGGKRATGDQMYEATQFAYQQIKFMHYGTRQRLDSASLKSTKISLTESNTAFSEEFTGKPVEHSMGRALAEASIWVDIIRFYHRFVHHDLVRNGYGGGTWFSRLYYLPGAPAGHRYGLSLDANVMSVMHRHANREILHSDANITVSRGDTDLLVSVGNPDLLAKPHRITLPRGLRVNTQTPATGRILIAPSLDSSDISDVTVTPVVQTQGAQATLVMDVPPYSFYSVTIPLSSGSAQ